MNGNAQVSATPNKAHHLRAHSFIVHHVGRAMSRNNYPVLPIACKNIWVTFSTEQINITVTFLGNIVNPNMFVKNGMRSPREKQQWQYLYIRARAD